jgi:hypothetical protein
VCMCMCMYVCMCVCVYVCVCVCVCVCVFVFAIQMEEIENRRRAGRDEYTRGDTRPMPIWSKQANAAAEQKGKEGEKKKDEPKKDSSEPVKKQAMDVDLEDLTQDDAAAAASAAAASPILGTGPSEADADKLWKTIVSRFACSVDFAIDRDPVVAPGIVPPSLSLCLCLCLVSSSVLHLGGRHFSKKKKKKTFFVCVCSFPSCRIGVTSCSFAKCMYVFLLQCSMRDPFSPLGTRPRPAMLFPYHKP